MNIINIINIINASIRFVIIKVHINRDAIDEALLGTCRGITALLRIDGLTST